MFKEKTLVQAIVFTAALTFFMPLVFMPSSFIFPFIVPKIIFFRILVLVMLGLYGLLLKTNWQAYRPRKSWLNIAVFGFWLSFAISTFAGVDWYRSLWDNHERMLGLFTVTHYVLLYLILSTAVRTKGQWQFLMRTFLGAAGAVMFLGLMQRFSPELLLNRGAIRHASTLGNAIYLSGYGFFVFCFGVLQFFQTKKKDAFWRYYSIAAAAFGFLGIFLGGTRGTFLGLLAATAIVLIFVGATTAQKKVKLGVIGLFLVGIAGLGASWMFKESTVVQSIAPLRRLVAIDVTNLGNNTRIMAWDIAWDSFLEKPAFGWGPNNYYYAFNQNYAPEFLRYGYGETWFDNAHNIVMNTFATQGAFGIITYFALFIIVAMTLLSARKQGKITDAEAAILTAFIVGHFVHNVFVFENPTSYLYFFFALAYISVRTMNRDEIVHSNTLVSAPATLVTLGVVMLAVFIFNINPANANTATLRTIQGLYRGAGVAEFAVATNTPTPHIDDVRNDFARTVTQVVPKLVEQEGGLAHVTVLLEMATLELEKNLLLHPNDIRIHLLLSQVYQQRAAVEKNPVYMNNAIAILEEALEYSPKRQQLYFSLGQFNTMIGDLEAAETALITARDLDKTVKEGWKQLMNHYNSTGSIDKATLLRKSALEFGIQL